MKLKVSFTMARVSLWMACLIMMMRYANSLGCVDHNPKCSLYAQAGYCRYSFWTRHYYRATIRSCPRSCRRCRCSQWHSSCGKWAADGYCIKNKAFMYKNCAKSCGLCGCTDDKRRCRYWAKKGSCWRYRSYMSTYCRKSCNLCGCYDIYSKCKHWARSRQCRLASTFMGRYCRKACGICGVLKIVPPEFEASSCLACCLDFGPNRGLAPKKKPKPKPTSPPPSSRDTSKVNSKYCGISSIKRVTGGRASIAGQYPWMVGIVRVTKKDEVICGATLITDQWVLSAAHCFTKEGGKDPKNYLLLLGEHHLQKKEGFELTASVSRIIVHPKFKVRTFDNDIALLRLKKKVKFTKRISPACLADPSDRFIPGTKCIITGWGALGEDKSRAKMLHTAKVPLVSFKTCSTAFQKIQQSLTKNMICAGHSKGGIDTCEGDSGGPLLCPKNSAGIYEQVGIVSWGYGCARKGLYGVYTYLQRYRKWINSVL